MKKKSSFFIVFLFFSLVVLGNLVWWTINSRPVNSDNNKKVFFVVNKGEGLAKIAGHLQSENLIRSSWNFRLMSIFWGTARKMKAGGYYLSSSMNPREISHLLTKGINDQWVTIVEGLRSEEICQLLIKKGFAINPKIWQEEIQRERLEGQLFPDSYLLPQGATQSAILNIFRKNFQKKVISGLEENWQSTGRSKDNILILASLVEREAKTDEDRKIVAGILFKRLETGWPLQIDATVQYVLGSKQCSILTSPCDWWPSKIGSNDLKVISLFNTYLYKGLPPSPICNPGLSAITAVLAPQESDFWYYLSDEEGKIHYAKTSEEHTANIVKYLRRPQY